MESEVEAGITGLPKIERYWAECRTTLAEIEKKGADVVVALVVTDIISASASLEQAADVEVAIPMLVATDLPSKPTIPHQATFTEAQQEETQPIQ